MDIDFDADDIYDELCEVYDPERMPATLADLNVITREGIVVQRVRPRRYRVEVTLVPTVPHCHLMTLIALSVRAKLHFALPPTTHWAITLRVPPKSHTDAVAIEKQVNDKERVAAALENPTLLKEVKKLAREDVEG